MYTHTHTYKYIEWSKKVSPYILPNLRFGKRAPN